MEYDHEHDDEEHEEEDEDEEDINLPPPQSFDSVPQPSATRPRLGQLAGPRKSVATKYRECLKNHAVSIGGHATDGCGEFLPAGDEGTLDALKCAACSCHRNFHRKETDVGIIVDPHVTVSPVAMMGGGATAAANSVAAMYHHPLPSYYQHHRTIPPPTGYLQLGAPGGPESGGMAALSSPTLPSHHHHLQYRPLALPSPRDEMDDMSHPSSSGGGGGSGGNFGATGKKRFRTKFSQEQKEKMLVFAERVGWRIQKQDEALVQQFCQEAQVKRQVLKVWMHNNKYTLGKKP